MCIAQGDQEAAPLVVRRPLPSALPPPQKKQKHCPCQMRGKAAQTDRSSIENGLLEMTLTRLRPEGSSAVRELTSTPTVQRGLECWRRRYEGLPFPPTVGRTRDKYGGVRWDLSKHRVNGRGLLACSERLVRKGNVPCSFTRRFYLHLICRSRPVSLGIHNRGNLRRT